MENFKVGLVNSGMLWFASDGGFCLEMLGGGLHRLLIP